MTTRRLLWIAVSAFLLYAAAAPSTCLAQTTARGRAISIGMVPTQENAPIQITSAISTREFLYEEVAVKNTSPYRITSLTFGVAIYPSDEGTSAPIIRRGESVLTELEPGRELVLKLDLIRPSQVYEAAQPQVTATEQTPPSGPIRIDIGLVEVDSDARPVFIYQPEDHGGFHEMPKPRTKSSLESAGGAPALAQTRYPARQK